MDYQVPRDAGLGAGSRCCTWGGTRRNLSEEEALFEVVTKIWHLHHVYGKYVKEGEDQRLIRIIRPADLFWFLYWAPSEIVY